MRLERRLQVRRGLELELDTHLRRGERGVDVSAAFLGGLAGEALIAQGLVRVDDVRQRVDREGEGLHTRSRGVDRVRGDHGDRLARVLRLVDEQRRLRREGDRRAGAEHRTHTRARHGRRRGRGV